MTLRELRQLSQREKSTVKNSKEQAVGKDCEQENNRLIHNPQQNRVNNQFQMLL